MPHSYRAICVVLGFTFLPCQQPAWSQIAREGKTTYSNFDIRDPDLAGNAKSNFRGRPKGLASQNSIANTVNAMNAAKAALAARIPALRLEMNQWGTAPETIGTSTAKQFLTPESSRMIADTARDFLTGQAPLFGLTQKQARALVLFANYYNPGGSMGWTEYRQEANGIPIFQGEIRFGFTNRGALARLTGNLAPALDYSNLPTKAAIAPAEAAARASATIGVNVNATQIATGAKTEGARVAQLANGPFVRPIRTELVYFPLEPGVATLAYSMVLWEKVDAYYVLVDAMDGVLLWRKNITDHQTQTATYNVYTDDSPGPLSPSNALPGTNTQASGINRTAVTLIGNEPPNTFNNLGWMTDGVNTTTGNNVDCGLDLSAPNGIDTGGRAVGSPNRVFSFSYNPPPLGADAPSGMNYRNGIVTNLFYWTNLYHDRLYLLGFTETARNFQTNNFSRGGNGNDAVSAEAQDSSGTNNANFSTPGDGSPGRMQMYIFTGPSPQRDGSLETDVFIHELTHGVSNRLHNNGSGLNSQQAGGMGEGWSDYYARAIASTVDEDVNGVYAAGNYVTLLLNPTFSDNYYYGIRRFPYAVKTNLGANGKPHNPMTFGDIDFQQINALNDGAYPPSPAINITANEVHNIGTIWCMMLFEMRARIIARLGWAVGNDRALQIVTDGMKLDPVNPTIIQARDSIIAADNAGFGGADVIDIRNGFATRGAGAGATTTTYSSSYFTIVESLYPSSAAGTITFSDSLGNNNGVAEPGEDLVFNIPLTDRLTTTDNNVNAKLGNYSASYGNVAASATLAKAFSYHVPANTACGTTLQIPFTVTSDNGTANVNVPLQVGAPTTTLSFTENFDGVTAPALPPGWTSTTSGSATATWKTATTPVVDSGNSALGPDIATAADASLVSPVIAIGAGSQQLSFKHRYTTETPFDGGVLEISIAGGAFTDIITAGGSFVRGGHGATISSSATGNVLIGRRCWSGVINAAGQVMVNLPAAASGQNVQFRWRFTSDSSTGSTGWNIDSVQISFTSYNCASIDKDGDGIPDGWESLYGFNPNDPGDAGQDFDGDGMTNSQEYIAGTDPNNAASIFRITSFSHDESAGTAALTFSSVNGRPYRIEYNDDLANPIGWTTLQDNVVGTGADIPINDLSAGMTKRFYRVVGKL
jgi:extracellular elastinolytic metalloproteinase